MNPRDVVTCAGHAPDALEPPARPRQPVGPEDQERHHVQAAVEHEHRRLAVEVVADRAAPQREVVVAQEADHRREVEPPLEPRLDLVHAAALDVERVLAREQAQVIVDRLGHHRRAGAARSLVVERQRGQQQHAHRERGHQGAAPARPPPGRRRRGGRVGPRRGEPALQRQRGRVLGQAALEGLAQERLGRRLVGAGLARGQVALERARAGRRAGGRAGRPAGARAPRRRSSRVVPELLAQGRAGPGEPRLHGPDRAARRPAPPRPRSIPRGPAGSRCAPPRTGS